MSGNDRDPKGYYELLEVSPKASLDTIKAAYRALAKKLHPDTSNVSGSEAKFRRLNEAYEVLSNGEKRRLYDESGRKIEDVGSRAYSSYYSSTTRPTHDASPPSNGSEYGSPFMSPSAKAAALATKIMATQHIHWDTRETLNDFLSEYRRGKVWERDVDYIISLAKKLNVNLVD